MVLRLLRQFVIMWLILSLIANTLYANDLSTGKLHHHIICQDDKEQSFALYLPKNYSNDSKWPLLMGFSPNGKGAGPLSLCQEVAEKLGWIVVVSNNSKNGHHEPIVKAFEAVKKEVFSRFNIDKDKIFAFGFSGGARVALNFANESPGFFQGVVAMGAFVDPKHTFKQSKMSIVGIVGDQDFNFSEYFLKRNVVTQPHINYWFDVFAGEHRWPEKKLVGEAMLYLYFQSFKAEQKEYQIYREKFIASKKESIKQLLNESAFCATFALESFLLNFPEYKDEYEQILLSIKNTPSVTKELKQHEQYLELVKKVYSITLDDTYISYLLELKEMAQAKSRLSNLAQGTMKSIAGSLMRNLQALQENNKNHWKQIAYYSHFIYTLYPQYIEVALLSIRFHAQLEQKKEIIALLGMLKENQFQDWQKVKSIKALAPMLEDPEIGAVLNGSGY